MNKEEFLEYYKSTKEENEVAFKRFLEEKSLYQKVDFFLFEPLQEFSFLPLQLVCPVCDGERTYSYDQENSDISHVPGRKTFAGADQFKYIQGNGKSKREILNERESNKSYKFTYLCSSCHQHSYSFLVSFTYDKVFKSGQEPSFGIHIEKNIEKKLGANLAKHYKNGKICELHGMGIASMAYYRRVVEDKVYSLLDDVADFVEASKKGEYSDVIAKVRGSHSFEEKAELLKDVIPPILNSDDGNYVKLLFSKVSEGLHSKSDSECLAIAHDVSELLEAIILIINSHADAKQSLKEITKRLIK